MDKAEIIKKLEKVIKDGKKEEKDFITTVKNKGPIYALAWTDGMVQKVHMKNLATNALKLVNKDSDKSFCHFIAQLTKDFYSNTPFNHPNPYCNVTHDEVQEAVYEFIEMFTE